MKRTLFKMQRASAICGILLAVLLILITAVPSFAAISWQAKTSRFAATAGETVVVGDVVCIKGSDGKAYLADANDSALRPAVGVIGKGGSSGATVEVVVEGVITGMTAASPGARVFLSETAGDFTATGPANAQALGWVMPGTAGAATSTRYYIRIIVPSSAGAGY